MAASASPSEQPTDPIERIDDILFRDEKSARASGQHREGGKFAKDPTAEAPDPKGPAGARGAESPEEGAESEEAEEPEQKAEGEEAGEGDEAPEGEEGDEGAVYTFADLANGLEIPEEELAAHLHIEGPAGESVPLADAIKSFREQPERAQALTELHQQREQLQAERATVRQEKDEHLNHLAALTQVMLQRVNPAASKAELDELRRNGDMSAYLVRKDEIEQEQGQIQRVLGEFEAEKQRRAEEDSRAHEQFVDAEVRKLKGLMPEWQKREHAASAMDEIGTYLRDTRGFSEKEVSELVDHRMVMVVWDAIQFRRLGKSKPAIAERIQKLRGKGAKSAPREGLRALPARARRGRDSTAARELRASRTRLRKEGSDEAADDFFGRIM
jgi:hypothetical protein